MTKAVETTAEDIRAEAQARFGDTPQERAQQAINDWNAGGLADFETAALDAYETAKDGSGAHVGEALGLIAAYFYNPSEHTDAEGNAYNALAFQQRNVLGNMCGNAKWMLENAQKHHDDLSTKLDQQEATADGSEIALRNLSITLDQIERARYTQIPACEEWYAMTTAAYHAITGEAWKPFVKGKSSAEQTADSVKARIAALRAG